jgi:hypothetical protein
MSATIITSDNSHGLHHHLAGKRLAIFAATMNPPTIAHDDMMDRLLAQKTSEGLPLYDGVYIHTTENSPTGHYKADTGSYEDRHAMAKAAFGRKDRVVLSDLDPLQTVSLLMQIPDLTVTHVVGADSLGWLQAVSDAGDAVFFQGTPDAAPQSRIQHPDTGDMYSFSGRAIYELRTVLIVVIPRGDMAIPAVFLGVPTEIFEWPANSPDMAAVSSSEIRRLVNVGELAAAKALLAPGLRNLFSRVRPPSQGYGGLTLELPGG